MASLQSTSVNGTLSATGAVTLSNYGAGFVKLNASGAIVIDTNSYLSSGSFLPLAGGTMTGILYVETTSDPKIVLRVPAGDTNQWNYINFVGSDGVRDAYFGTDGSGNPQWYRDDNGLNITLGSTATVNGVQIVTNSGTWGISITGNAATLGGYGPNQTGGANTIVQRDANGYIQNSYFYSSGGGSERNGSGLGYIAGFNSSDYYIRSYNSTAVASFLGLGSMAYASTANYIYTNSGNFTTAGTGWYRVATTGSDGRGTYYVEVYTTGGNHNPSYLKILAHGDWGNDKLVSVETDGGFPASSVRITRGASNTFLEVYFTTTILGASLRVNRFGFDSSVQIYTGALPSGGDTQQDIVSVYSKGYHTPGAVFAKTRMLVGGTDDNSGKADLSVDTGGTATIALAGQYFRVGDSDVNWDLAIRRNGNVETYGQALNLNTQAGNYAVNIRPNNTVVAQYYQDYTYFPGLDFSISRVNSAHASNYFRGSSSHLVIGTGGTLYLNYGNTSGTTYIDGTTYINSAVALHANNYNSYSPTLTGGGASGTWGINVTGTAASETLTTVTGRGAITNSFVSLLGGSRIVVQNSTDGGNNRGIFMWNTSDTNWGIYMSTAGASKSLSSGTASSSIDGQTSHHIRFRAGGGSDNGFIWENPSEQTLMSLKGNNGNLYTRGQIYAGNSTSNLVLHTGNYNSYALPLSGGTMTGAILSTASNQNFTNFTARNTSTAASMQDHLYYYIEARYNSGANGTNVYHWVRSSWEYNITNNYSDITMGAYGNGTSYGVLFRVSTDGQVYATNSFRAPIFYDSANSAYYVDPNSQSRMSTLWLSNGGFSGQLYIGGDSVGARLNINSDQIWTATGNLYLQYSSSGWVYLNDGGGHTQSATSMRAPIFYDSQDTTYYLDPNSTTSSILRGSVGLNSTSPINTAWGNATTTTQLSIYGTNYAVINLRGDAGGVRTYSMGVGDNQFYMAYDNSASSHRLVINSSGNVTAAVSFNAPIFYDSADTFYYVDPASTSRIGGIDMYSTLSLRQGSQINLYTSANNLRGYIQATDVDDNHFTIATSGGEDIVFRDGGISGTRNLVIRGGNAGTEAYGSMRAPIYYDSANTAYYGDFASTSRLNVLDANSIYTSGGLSTNGGNSLLGVQSPGGASRANGGSTETGAFKITLPSGIPVYGMFKLVIHIYEYGQRGNGYEIHCGGHMYPNYMYNRFQVQYGTANAPLNVRYGNDGTNGCIWIGDTNTTWSYPQIWVSEFMMGYSNTSWTTWRSGWNISLVTSYGNSGAMDGPYTCEYGYASSAGSASTSSQVTINYNDNSNANYQLLWGSGNNVYGTSLIYCNPSTDTIYSRALRGSDNVSGTGEATYHPAGIYSTGTNWLYGTMYLNGNTVYDADSFQLNGRYSIWGRWNTYSGYITKIAYMTFDYNSNNGHEIYHSIASTDINGSYSDAVSLNSYNDITLRLDSNNNNANSYLRISNNSAGDGTIAWIGYESGMNQNYFSGSVGISAGPRTDGYRLNMGGSIHLNGNSVDYVGSLYLQNGPGVHLQGNTDGSYGSLQITQTKNSWAGIYFTATGNTLMMNSNESGFYRQGYGWQWRWENGTAYVNKNGQGGGTSATVLDTSNFTTWAQPKVYQGQSDGNWQNFTNDVGEFRVDEVLNINAGGHSNQPPNVYTYGGVLSWRTNNHSFQLYASHTGDITFKTQWGNDNYSGWRRILHEANYNSWAPSLTGGGASGTWGISITGNADTVDGYHASNFLGYNGNSYYQVNTWLQMNGTHGIYWPSYNGAHFYVNTTSSYTQFRLDGSRGGYGGIWDSYSAVAGIMYDGSGNGGVYREANGRWYMYYHLGNDCMGIGTSSTNSGYSVYSNKGHFVNLSGSNVSGFYNYHSGGISSGAVVNAFTAEWTTYGASFNIVYKQGELSPSDMCHIYNQGGFYMKIFDGSSNRFHRWDDNGAVSINSSSQGSYTFNVTGDIYATADVIAFSDARVKEDVRTVENALDKVTKLRGVTYIKKDEDNKKRKMGVIAQEVLEVLPEVVHEDNDGYYGVSYGNIVGVLIEAIKEQQKQIDELKQELKNK